MHNLRIEGRKLFLDGFELKDVESYKLKADAGTPYAGLTLKLAVQDIQLQPERKNYDDCGGTFTGSLTVSTPKRHNLESVAQMGEVEKLLERYFGQEVVVKIDGAELGKAAIKAINEVQRGTDSGPLNI
jgi:hypothetical protein